MAMHAVYRFYAEMEGYSPKIWRRFEVNGSKTMAELGYTLMTMFEMQASHLFRLNYNYDEELLADMRKRLSSDELDKVLGKSGVTDLLKVWRFELPFEDGFEYENEQWCDASKYRLKDITHQAPLKLTFNYDYGDGWRVNLTLENCAKVEIHASELPRVLAGEGFGIIEDCGGVGGLADLERAFKKRKGRRYNEYRQWLGVDDLDLTTLDIDDLNFRLKKLPRIYKECYEYDHELTQRSIDLIERKYKK